MPALTTRTRLAAAAAVTAGALALFVVWTVLTATGRLAGADARVHDAMTLSEHSAPVGVLRLVAVAGGVEVAVAAVAVLVAVAAVVPRMRLLVGSLVVILAATGAVEYLLKTHLDHPPPGGIVDATDLVTVFLATPFSYPSGHVLRITGLALTVLLALRMHNRTWARVAAPALAALVIAVLYSRLALADHWFTDVVGGVLLVASVAPWLLVAGAASVRHSPVGEEAVPGAAAAAAA